MSEEFFDGSVSSHDSLHVQKGVQTIIFFDFELFSSDSNLVQIIELNPFTIPVSGRITRETR